MPSLRSWGNKGDTYVRQNMKRKHGPHSGPQLCHHKLLPYIKFIPLSPRRARCSTLKDDFVEQTGWRWRSERKHFPAALKKKKKAKRGGRDETNARNYWAIWIAGFKAGEERKWALKLLQPLGSSGQTRWQVYNCGNEERWSLSMKGHCFGLKCMNSCCYYARFFGLAGARRFFSKAYSLVQCINICKSSAQGMPKPQRAIEFERPS